MKKFHESDFYKEYKYIRNQFRKYNQIDLLVKCFEFLHKKEKNRIDEISKKQPWQVLLLIKWMLMDDNFLSPVKNKPTDKDFFKILQLVRDLGSKVRMPNEYEHHYLFFRNVSYQQFLYQIDFNVKAFTRQMILFSKLEKNHYIKVSFRKKYNLEIQEFIELSIYLISGYLSNLKPLRLEYFTPLFDQYGKEKIAIFLEIISLSLKGARDFLLEESKAKRTSQEFYEQTPLIRQPVLKINQLYYPYNLNILYRGLEHFVYDSVRDIDAQKFMGKFGSIFEGYIRMNLEYAEIEFINEEYLTQAAGQSSKVVDFLIQEENKSIFIDAKGVEMSYLGKVTHQPRIVQQKVKSSAIKGIEQAYELIRNLEKRNSKLISGNHENNYLLIITYKELHLGSGKDFRDSIANKYIDELTSRYNGEYFIPMRNIYFISIDSFELWIEMIKQKKITLGDGLEKAIHDDKRPETMKFDFIQHVDGWNKNNELPDFLLTEFNSLFDKSLKIVSKDR